MIKILVVIGVLFLLYKVLFKKPNNNRSNNASNNPSFKEDELKEEIMLECFTCNILVSQNEAILDNKAYFCSQECIDKRNEDVNNR